MGIQPTKRYRIRDQRVVPPRPIGMLAELAQERGCVDPTDAFRWLEQRVVGQPERWLALEALCAAVEDAASTPKGPRDARRDAARAWLLDDAKGYSARLCCEALGIDYDVLRERIEQTWKAMP